MKTRVLVVDDDPELREATSELIEDAGYEVEQAANGAEALARLRASDPPSLVLLDMMMPVMDGWELLSQRKQDARLRGIPVIVVSADDSAKARAVDADGFVQKPFVRSELTDLVRRLLELSAKKSQQLREVRLDQLTSLGRLAAGVAHEINNPLTWVAGNLALLDDRLETLELAEIRELVRGALEGAERIGRIVGGLKMLVCSEEDAPASIDVSAAIDSALHLAGNELRHRVSLTRDDPAGLSAWGSASRTTQLLLNLVLTLVQRLPEGAAAEHSLHLSARSSGERVIVELDDSGAPIDRHMADGLGMTLCRQLASELGAELQIGGASIRVLLPVAPPEKKSLPPAVKVVEKRAKVLVVDDEPRIGSLLSRALSREHEVTALTSAKEALSRITGGERFDVILCDMMMPEMTGMDLHAELCLRAPEEAERMVFITGGAFTPRAQTFLEKVENPRLDKPIDLGRLRALIRSQLG